MKIWLSFLLVSTFYPCTVKCQTHDVQLPAHSVLSLQLTNPAPMRVGQPVRARIVYPISLLSGYKLNRISCVEFSSKSDWESEA
jgi:hypothetical protein